MTTKQKLENEKFFKKVAMMGKMWVYPDMNLVYDIIDGKFKPRTKRGLKVLQELTTKEFHRNFIISK